MKKLFLIITLTSSLYAFGQNQPSFQPDYYEHKTDQELKDKEKYANGKILTGIVLFFLGIITISSDGNIEDKKVLHVSGGAAIGSGLTIGVSGIIDKIEVGKVKRKRNK